MPNVAIVRRSYVAFAADDMDGVVGDMHPDIVWHQAQGLPHGGVYHGLAEVRRNVFDPLDRDWWSEFTAEPEEFLDAGAEIMVLGRYRGVAKETGRKLDVPFVHVWTLEDGKAVRFRQFLDTAGWVEAPLRSLFRPPPVDMSVGRVRQLRNPFAASGNQLPLADVKERTLNQCHPRRASS